MHFTTMLFTDPKRHVGLYRQMNHNKLSKIYAGVMLHFRSILISTLQKIPNLIQVSSSTLSICSLLQDRAFREESEHILCLCKKYHTYASRLLKQHGTYQSAVHLHSLFFNLHLKLLAPKTNLAQDLQDLQSFLTCEGKFHCGTSERKLPISLSENEYPLPLSNA